MKTNLIRLISFFILLFIASSCSLAYRLILGVDTTPDWASHEEIKKLASKYEIPPEASFLLDTGSYHRATRTLHDDIIAELTDSTAIKKQLKVANDDLQPTQFRLFNQKGIEFYKVVNCYVYKAKDWNVENSLDTFPPKTSIENLNVHAFDLQFLLAHVRTFDGTLVSINDLPKSDYYAIVMWNDFMIKPSKHLIREVKSRVAAWQENVTVIYINNHNDIIWNYLDAETKAHVFEQLSE